MSIKIFNSSNHYLNDDAHPQYSNIYGKYKSPRYSGDGLKYYKFLDIDISKLNNVIIDFDVISGEGAGLNSGGKFNVYFRSNVSDNVEDILIIDSIDNNKNNTIIVTKKDHIYRFYFKFNNTYDRFYIALNFTTGQIDFDEFGYFYEQIPSDEVTATSKHKTFCVNSYTSTPNNLNVNGLLYKEKSLEEERDILKIGMDYKNSYSFREILTKDHVCIRTDKSLPPASQYYLGHFKMTKVDGSDSTLWICIQLSDGTYSWKRISLS